MTSLTITLSDELAKIAEEQGLLTTDAIEAYVREKAREAGGKVVYPPGFDERLYGAAAPELVGTAHCVGDIVAPLGIKWEAAP